MTRILHLETSTEVCSVCLSEGKNVVLLKESRVVNSHSSLLTLLIRECMIEAGWTFSGLHAVAVSSGPGSYTSLRIGGSTAKGLCFGADLPLIAIDSLSILAEGIDRSLVQANDFLIPMIDARRMEVYSAVFSSSGQLLQPAEAVILEKTSFSQLYSNGCSIHICGSGAPKFFELADSTVVHCHHTYTSAKYMVSPAIQAFEDSNFTELSSYSPDYIKGPHITETKKKFF